MNSIIKTQSFGDWSNELTSMSMVKTMHVRKTTGRTVLGSSMFRVYTSPAAAKQNLNHKDALGSATKAGICRTLCASSVVARLAFNLWILGFSQGGLFHA